MPSEARIKIVLLRAAEQPQELTIDNTLASLQQLVGGYIQAVPVTIDDCQYVLVVDEEGRINHKPTNLVCHFGAFVGDILFCKSDAEGEFISLNHEDIKRIKEFLESESVSYYL
ncbi:MAG: DUF3846 domain-containing protein [Firmicutes bacterium]|nr:DUF3846 domain-containing protein [Bacillota bacterium]